MNDSSPPQVPEFWHIFTQPNYFYTDAHHWEKYLVFGQYPLKEVLKQVKNEHWQKVRVGMLGMSHEHKWNELRRYLLKNNFSHHSKVVVTNYVYALKRGGVIK